MHKGRDRLRCLLVEVCLASKRGTKRWGLTVGELLELLMAKSLSDSSRLDYLGSWHLGGERKWLSRGWHVTRTRLKLPVWLGRLLDLKLT